MTNARANVAEMSGKAGLRLRAGAVTEGYSADREKVIAKLNAALATEVVCMLRYKRHYYMAEGIHSKAVAEEFLEHAAQEQDHADTLAARIVQLGGEPDFSPDSLTGRSHAEYSEGGTLQEMIADNLLAERVAIDTYRSLIQYIGNDDPTTRRMLEDILAMEEEHADELAAFAELQTPR